MCRIMKRIRRKAVAFTAVLTMVSMLSSDITAFAAESGDALVVTMKNSSTRMEEDWSGGNPYSASLAKGVVRAAENESFILYYHPDTLAIQIVDKRNGIVHSSIVEEGEEIEGMNDTWRGMMQSGITLELMDAKGSVRTWPLSTKNAAVTVQETGNGFCAEVYWPEGIGITVETELTEDGIAVRVPEEGIREDEDSEYVLQSIYCFPFLDANRGHTQNGYMFVPDGCGALIRTCVETISGEPYEKQIYGSDIGLGKFNGSTGQSMLLDSQNIYVPVYGMIQNVNESGMAAIIEEGDEYAEIVAYASGITTDFNFITAKFLVRETYQMKISQSGDSITANQEERNHFDAAVSYHFLTAEDADYIGIAKSYREYLTERGILEQKEAAREDIPLKLEFIVSEQKDALIGTSTVSLTSASEADEILEDVMAQGITDLKVVLRGVSKEGATAAAPTVFDFERSGGSKKDWQRLAEKYKAMGADISFYCDFTRGYEGVGGYSDGDRAQSINKLLLETFDNGMFTYLSPEFSAKALSRYADSVQTIGISSLAVDCLGYSLYSNWNNRHRTTRAEAKAIFENLDPEGVSLAFYTPNAYLFSAADAVYDVPTENSGYYIFTDTVPFLQIVLRGSLPMYGSGFNFHANENEDLLKCIEYGIYPSFYLTKEETIELLDTASSWLYTSEYALWRESIFSGYARIKEAFEGIEGECIADRIVLAQDVVKVEYENGIGIIVNYSDADYTDGEITVAAKGYLQIKGRD